VAVAERRRGFAPWAVRPLRAVDARARRKKCDKGKDTTRWNVDAALAIESVNFAAGATHFLVLHL
jgi:hypothetical protein